MAARGNLDLGRKSLERFQTPCPFLRRLCPLLYMLRPWEKRTLFLRQAGAPLDNNVCERALKKAILHRMNALFYKTKNGARVGDLFMSLLYTCQVNEANPFDYPTELQRHSDQLAASPQFWMPWNYRAGLA